MYDYFASDMIGKRPNKKKIVNTDDQPWWTYECTCLRSAKNAMLSKFRNYYYCAEVYVLTIAVFHLDF